MSAFADKILAQLQVKFNISLLNEIKFFNKPASLTLLTSAAQVALGKMSEELKLKIAGLVDFDINDLSSLKNFLKLNPQTNLALVGASNELDENILSSLLLQCEILNDPSIDISLKEEALKEFSSLNFLGDGLNKLLDFIGDLAAKLAELIDTLTPYIGIALFLYYIIKLMIDLISNSRFPSTYRLKYIQKLIRMGLKMIEDAGKDLIGEAKEGLEKLKSVFDGLDELLITLAIATALYLYNRAQLQKQSTEQLAENLCEDLGLNPFEDVEANVTSDDFEISLECPIEVDTVIVPKEPFENRQNNFSCEVPDVEDVEELKAIIKEDLATKAIIVNEKEDELIPVVNVDSKVTDQTVIATLGSASVYSPVNGYITSLQPNEITLRDISDSTENYLTQTINELNQKYTEMNEIKIFLKDWEVVSQYPVMLANCPLTDGSTNVNPIKFKHGMDKEFDKIKKFWNKKILKPYDKNIKKITGKDNIKKNSENETLHLIKEQIEKEENKVNKYLKDLQTSAINLSNTTLPKKGEFELIEYFIIELATPLNAVKDPSGLVLEYRDNINLFTAQRYVIDGWKPKQIRNKGNDLIDKLEKGITAGDWFKKGLKVYNERKKLSDVKHWLENIKNPRKLEVHEKKELIAKLMYLYEFYLGIQINVEKYKDLAEADNKEQVIKEGSYISNFFGRLWIRFNALPNEIEDLENRISNLGLFTAYSISEVEGEEYRNYLIPSGKDSCKGPEIDPNLGGATETDFGDIKYWLKYCSFATLVGLNPATWSTGFILPTGPVLLPTVYLPIKPISTSYGFAVLGLTITGIWIFPMLLFVNYSTNYSLPIADPAAFIREQITGLKKTISAELKNFKKGALTVYAKKIAEDVESLNVEVKGAEEAVSLHRLEKPPKDKKHRQELVEWNLVNVELKEVKTEVKLRRWAEEKKYGIVYRASTIGSSTGTGATDKGLAKIQETEDFIMKQLDSLDALAEKADKIVAPLPITLQPETANFGITVKNPKPVINIASEIDDNINETPLTKITEKFKLKNEDLMTKVGTKFDYKKYTGVIKASMPALIKKDPFPAYENLGLLNIPYLTFLAKDFTVTGSQTYGFPGQPPFPIG